MVLVLKSDHFIIKYSFRDYTPILITKLNFFQNYCTILWIFVLPMKLIQIHLLHIQLKNSPDINPPKYLRNIKHLVELSRVSLDKNAPS